MKKLYYPDAFQSCNTMYIISYTLCVHIQDENADWTGKHKTYTKQQQQTNGYMYYTYHSVVYINVLSLDSLNVDRSSN